MRLFLASLLAETNTFCVIPTGRGAFEEQGICRQIDDPGDLMGMRPALVAVREFAESAGWDVVLGLCTAAQPLGPVVEDVYQEFRGAILSDLAAAMPVDAVVLVLHGAMTTETCNDCEGDLLSAIRRLVGPKVPIGISLDLHCHFTAEMRAATPIHVAYKEYPHTDIVETAVTVTKLAIAAREGSILPQIGWAKCPMIGVWPTTNSPMREIVEELRQIENQPGILSVSLGHGMAYGDVPEAGACAWVVADGDIELAKFYAEHLSNEFYRLRHEISPTFTSLNDALDQLANWQAPRPLALADFADNPGGGAMGDSTFILQGLIERGIGGIALGGIWDPGAVQLCFDAGVGAKFLMRIGGKTGPASGLPTDVTAQVMALVPDHSQDDFGARANLGPSAWVRTEQGIDVALISVRQQVLGLDLFTGLGIELNGRRGIVVKSMQHFLSAFDTVVGNVLFVATPGLLSTDFANIPFKHRDLLFWPRENYIDVFD
ncbi:M81 family metallopeptidase [Sphingorhabdus sp.]|jgi:microcystin degradation protein MlrC|uniref:M81 family metallopeptidase n=1 Tax=Sphingorhabdus sp. TaxID=1902408 RepID=UPI0037C57E77